MTKQTSAQAEPISVGVSACLLGEYVRYDGHHKLSVCVVDIFARLFQLRSICPEVGAGLGIPRKPVHLIRRGGEIRAVGVTDSHLDVTDRLLGYVDESMPGLSDICGYIFKSRSPSCGVTSTPIEGDGVGAGLFAAAIKAAYPLMPLVEEEMLVTPAQRCHFIGRVVGYFRWRQWSSGTPDEESLAGFHQNNRLTLLSHGAAGLAEMDQWLEGNDSCPFPDRLAHYGQVYMAQLQRPQSRVHHVHALKMAAKSLQASLARDQQVRLGALIQAFADGRVLLWEPLTLLRQWAEASGHLLTEQSYLHPHRAELACGEPP